MIDQAATKIDALAKNLTYFPHDFVRDDGFLERARRAYAEDLLAELPDEDNLSHHWIGVFAERMQWDSAFFGYNVARLHGVYRLQDWHYPAGHEPLNYALRNWTQLARRRAIRYAWTVVPSENVALIAALCTNGWRLIETRVTYWRTLHDYAYPERYPVRLATAHDGLSLADVSSRNVNPFDRFHADPFLDPRIVDKLFRVWPINSITQGFADAVLVPDVDNAPARAWVSLKYHIDQWDRWGYKLARPGNGAVDPSMQGWYTKLISECCYHLKDIGVDAMYIPTQATNRAVISAWHKLGFRYGHCEHVFRVVL